MIEVKVIFRAVKENFKTSFVAAVMRLTKASSHGTDDKFMKRFA
jgi:hypothetical protein